MPVLRDPLIIAMLASSLAHAAVFALAPASTTQPNADVRPGRTAVRLRPSLPTPTEVTSQPDTPQLASSAISPDPPPVLPEQQPRTP
ncbi:MAG: hypothetical protein VX669_09050, partial [Planctomycetota bacterium]|nr:hypothetical protein [Planctomycetota bacterium]